MNTKFFNKRLLWIGAGSLAGMIGGSMLTGTLRGQGGMLANYSKEITGVSMTVAGSYILATQTGNVSNVGMGVGAMGVGILAQSAFSRVMGSGGNAEGSEEGTGGFKMPWGETIPEEDVYTA